MGRHSTAYYARIQNLQSNKVTKPLDIFNSSTSLSRSNTPDGSDCKSLSESEAEEEEEEEEEALEAHDLQVFSAALWTTRKMAAAAEQEEDINKK
jgi:hypothetical protein